MKKKSPSIQVPAEIAGMLRLTNPDSSTPNINDLWRVTKDVEALKLTVKFFGYELAKALLASLPPLPGGGPFQAPMTSRPATQADLEANWSRYWSAQIGENHAIHRRAWEHAYVLQAISQAGRMRPGAKGLVLGAGDGPLVSYLAAKGCEITATDTTPPDAERLFRSNLLDRATFDRNVKLRTVDLNAIPQDLRGFDFCFSVGRAHMLGSIARGLQFMDSTADVLNPGGLAIHTTEFSFAVDGETIDNWGTVLFQRRHFEDIAQRLNGKGCRVMPLSFDVGSQPLDRFIDVPPFEMPGANLKDWSRDAMHIKVNIDGFPCTSFGLISVRN